MKSLKKYLKEKYCEGNKGSNLFIANSTYNPCKLPKQVQNILHQSSSRYTVIYTAKSVIYRISQDYYLKLAF
jgi:hypothetical protein